MKTNEEKRKGEKQMKKKENLIREVVNLFKNFFKPYGLKEEVLEIPENIRRMGFKLGIMKLSMTVISLSFAFMLKLTNLLVEQKIIILGIICFMLYRGQQVVKETFNVFAQSEAKKFDGIFADESIIRTSQIIGKVQNRVLKYDSENKLYKIRENEEVSNSLKNYLTNFWRHRIQHVFDLCEMVSIIGMLMVAIVTNTSIPQIIFVPLIIIFGIISFFGSAYISLNRERYYSNKVEYDNEQLLIFNDILRVPIIVNRDLDMRINKFRKTVHDSNENTINFYKKMNVSRLITTVIETFSQYGLIVFYLCEIVWDRINLGNITEITAILIIVETALGYIRSIAETINNSNERITIMKKEKEDISLILDIYNKMKKGDVSKRVRNIEIDRFSIKYMAESENDKPFTLVSEKKIYINKGDVVILSGPSGSGKSTFMKMLTERIKIEKSTEIPATSRYLFYDEKLKLGSLSIFEELFCGAEDPNLEKMKEILGNLHLWTEIQCNCLDVWKWMKQKKFGQTLSNGQNQRLILAKMLYWLDDEIDVVALDECTSGLDDKSETDAADAERILNYIVRFCNQDKKRIIVIASHQQLYGFKEKLKENKYILRNLEFQKIGGKNIVKEI